MTDATTRQPLRVCIEGTAGPYIRVPVSQIDQVRRLLASRGVRHWLGENAVSWNDAPAVAEINLGRDGDAKVVQEILDSIR